MDTAMASDQPHPSISLVTAATRPRTPFGFFMSLLATAVSPLYSNTRTSPFVKKRGQVGTITATIPLASRGALIHHARINIVFEL